MYSSRGRKFGALLLLLNFLTGDCLPCKVRRYGQQNVVCVCTAKYCDDPGPSPETLLQDDTTKFLHYESSMDGKRLERSELSFAPEISSNISLTFEIVMQQYQEIFGFGCAITDSVGINLKTVGNDTQEKLLRQYFGPEGIGYTFIRVPLGGTDFSLHSYSYDDYANDTTLSHFSLAAEDFLYKIPYIWMVQNMSAAPVKILTASWSAPEWMKQQRFLQPGYCRLQDQYYNLYADYIIKYLDAYKEHGILFWGITPQNEPYDGLYYYLGFNSMGWLPEEQFIWIRDYLGPSLHARGYTDVKLILYDDQRLFLKEWVDTLLNYESVMKYASGIAIHWYTDFLGLPASGPAILDRMHNSFPQLFLIYTEASIMPPKNTKPVRLGDWKGGELYAFSILQNLNHSVVGWIDWNLVLNTYGGPTWAHNYLDAAIIVNASAQEFYKQPMFYAIAHFSYFVPPGSHRIQISVTSESDRNIDSIAFYCNNSHVVIVMLNRNDNHEKAAISIPQQGVIELSLPAHSFHTLVYKSNISFVPSEDNASSLNYGLLHGAPNLYITLITCLLFIK